MLAIMQKNSSESKKDPGEAIVFQIRGNGGLVRPDKFEIVEVWWDQQDKFDSDGEKKRLIKVED